MPPPEFPPQARVAGLEARFQADPLRPDRARIDELRASCRCRADPRTAQPFLGELTVRVLRPRSRARPSRYTLDETDPTPHSPQYSTPFTLRDTATVRAAAFAAANVHNVSASLTVGKLGPDAGIYLSDLRGLTRSPTPS